jgi:hypothetical protein
VTAAPTDQLVTAAIEVEIATLMRKYHRMPEHWEARRLEVMREIEKLIDQWLALSPK